VRDRLRQFFVAARKSNLIGGSGFLLTDRVVRIGLGLAINVVMARTLGPANFGLFAYAVTLAALFLPLSTLGLQRIVVRELARGNASEGSMLGSMSVARLAGGFLGCALAVLVAAVTAETNRGLQTGLVALVAAGNLLQAFDVIDWSFQAKGDFKRGTAAKFGAYIVMAGIKLIILFAGAGLISLAIATMAEMLLSAVFQAVAWWRADDRQSGWQFDPTLTVAMLRLSAPLLAGEIAGWVFQKADMLILQRFASESEVGYYAIAQRLAQVGFFLPVLAVQVFSPMVAQVQTEAEALALVQKVMNGLVLVAYALSLCLMLSSGFLVCGLFGGAFAPAAGLLVYLAWSNVFVFMGCAHTLYLVNRDAQKLSLRLAWITAVASIGLNIVLVPWLHALGAVLANLGAYAMTTIFGVVLFRTSRPLLAVNLWSLASPITLFRSGPNPPEKPAEPSSGA